MKVFSLVEGVMLKLGNIPGLSFLSTYVTDIHGRKTRIDQTIGDYQGWVQSARGAASDVSQAARGSKKDQDSDEIDDDDDSTDDEDETYLQ